MTKAASVLINAMIASLISAAAQADIYRCSVNGETQYTDHPCAGGERVAKDDPNNSKRKLHATEDARAKAEARKREIEAEAAKREASELWKRRNMSVACFTQKYNIWVSGRNPRPTREESDRKIDELMRECRAMYRIPQDLPPRGSSSAQK